MTTARMNEIFNESNNIVVASATNVGIAAIGVNVLSKLGYEGHDALSAVSMMAMGTVATHTIARLVMPIPTGLTLFGQIKDMGLAKNMATILAEKTVEVLVGGALSLLMGKALRDIAKDSTAIAAGVLLVGFPLACSMMNLATVVLHDADRKDNQLRK